MTSISRNWVGGRGSVASECDTYGLTVGEVIALVSLPFSLKARQRSTVTPLPWNSC